MTLIDNCDVEKLISAVQYRRPIYDNSAKEHGSRGLLEHLWNEIAEEMNAPVNKCKAKWQQLRNSFVRSYRGTSGYGKKRKKWYLHDALSFMEDHIQLHKLDDVAAYPDDRGLEKYDIEEKTNIPQTTYDESSAPEEEDESIATDQKTTGTAHHPPTTPLPYPPPNAFYHQHPPPSTVPLSNLQKSHQHETSPYHHHHPHHHSHSHLQNHCETSQDNISTSPITMPPPPKLQPMPPQMQPIPPKYVNIPNSSSVIQSSVSQAQEENPLLNFCKGILPEFDRLSPERQRKFKTEILNCLNHHLDEQEKDNGTHTEHITLSSMNCHTENKRKLSRDDELHNKFKSE